MATPAPAPSRSRATGAERRILVLHNRYKQAGGEDGVVAAEVRLLREAGHTVELLEESNERIRGLGKATAALSASYSFAGRRRVAEAIARFQPDVMHCHNLFPLLSASVYDAARAAGVPVVQTLHNFRMQCVNGLLLRDGAICEECVGRTFPHAAVARRCYQASAAGSAAAAAAIAFNSLRRTYLEKVDLFVALTEFCRRKFVEFGLPADRIVIKPNFLDTDPGPASSTARKHILFAGRISPEKGLATLLAAWPRVHAEGLKLRIIGDGPDAARLREATASDPSVEWLGRLPQEQVRRHMAEAIALVVPSLWYEGFPLVAVEAFATGTPLVASDIGSLTEIVSGPRAGLLVPPGRAPELAAALSSLIANPSEAQAMGARARRAYRQQYTAAHNLGLLESIYSRACAEPSVATRALPAWTRPSAPDLLPILPPLPASPTGRAIPADPGSR